MNGRLIVIILSTIAAVITIITFSTGKYSLNQIFNDFISESNKTSIPNTNQDYILPTSKIIKNQTEKHPILDKTIYVGRYFNDFIVGGINIEHIKYSVRDKHGEKLKAIYGPGNNWLSITYWDEPFFEIEYNERYFSIEVKVDSVRPVFTIKEIPNVTMKLINISK